MWVDYHVFLTAPLVTTRLPLLETTCNYKTASWWDLPPYWNTIWLINYGMLISIWFLDDLILGFLLQQFDIGNQWVWTRVDCHPCVTSKRINQVCYLANDNIGYFTPVKIMGIGTWHVPFSERGFLFRSLELCRDQVPM